VLLCLDNGMPRNQEELARSILFSQNNFGNEGNRFYDKPFQFVVFENSMSGLIGEHSGVDGHPVTRFLERVLEREIEFFFF